MFSPVFCHTFPAFFYRGLYLSISSRVPVLLSLLLLVSSIFSFFLSFPVFFSFTCTSFTRFFSLFHSVFFSLSFSLTLPFLCFFYLAFFFFVSLFTTTFVLASLFVFYISLPFLFILSSLYPFHSFSSSFHSTLLSHCCSPRFATLLFCISHFSSFLTIFKYVFIALPSLVCFSFQFFFLFYSVCSWPCHVFTRYLFLSHCRSDLLKLSLSFLQPFTFLSSCLLISHSCVLS